LIDLVHIINWQCFEITEHQLLDDTGRSYLLQMSIIALSEYGMHNYG